MKSSVLVVPFATITLLSSCVAPTGGGAVPDEANALESRGVDEATARTSAALDDLLATRSRSLSGPDELSEGMPVRFRAGGFVRSIMGPGFRIAPTALGLTSGAASRDVADTFVRRYAGLWGVPAAEFDAATVRSEHHASPLGADADRITYAQVHDGYSVFGAEISIVVDSHTSAVLAAIGSFVPFDRDTAAADVSVDAADAVGIVGDGSASNQVYWSGLVDGTASAPRLAWDVRSTDPDGTERDTFVDVEDGRELGTNTSARPVLRRALTDDRSQVGYREQTCKRWSTSTANWPGCVSGCTRAACVACATDPSACARCTCFNSAVSDPPACETSIWQYDDLSGGCVANGDPVGETNCNPQSLQLWNDASLAYTYWSTAFGRDGWNGFGAWMLLRSNVNSSGVGWAGNTQRRRVGANEVTFFPQVNVVDTVVDQPWVDGHELGHALQFGTYSYNATFGFYQQTIDSLESNADVHSFRYRGLPLDTAHSCSNYDHVHYRQYSAVPDLQTNAWIGDCHSWLLSRVGAPVAHHGVSVTPVSTSTFDQVWFRALDLYFTGGDDYFDWWNDQVTAAADLYGVGSATHLSFVAARDAIGGWTPNTILTTSSGGALGGLYSGSDRIAAVGRTATSTRSPCIFARLGSANIYWSCRESTGWRAFAAFNTAADPSAAEPTATFRWEGGRYLVYVLWTGTDSRIHYRTLDTSTYAISGPLDMGAGNLAVGPVAAAPIFETGSLDRVMVAYHPSAHPTWFSGTWIGNPAAATDLGGTFDSAIAPALVGFPTTTACIWPDRTAPPGTRSATAPTPWPVAGAQRSLSPGCSRA